MDPANPNQPENPSQTNTPVSPENPTIVQPPTIDIPEPAPPPTVPGPELPPVTPTEPIMDTHGNVAAPPVLEPMQTSEVHNSSGGDSKKYFKLAGYVFIGIAVLIAAYLAAAKFYLYTWPFTPPVQETVLKKAQATPSSAISDTTANWEEYEIKTIGLKIKLPPKLTQKGKGTEKILPLDDGTELRFSHIDSATDSAVSKYSLLSLSNDYVYPGGDAPALALKHRGYVNNGGSIRFKGEPGWGEDYGDNLPGVKVIKEIENKNKVKVLMVTGTEPLMPDEPMGALSSSQFGAIINLDHPVYPAITFESYVDANLTQEEFEQMVNTIKID